MSARNGKLPIPIPPVITSPQWLGRFSTDVRKAIVALRDRPVIVTGQPSTISRGAFPPFAVISLAKAEGDTFDVTIQEGWVIERLPKTGEASAVKFHMPKSGTTDLNADPKPKFTMGDGDILWVNYETDAQGKITGDVTVIVDDTDQPGTHYQPEDPLTSGTNGDYFVKLLELSVADGTPTVTEYQQSDIEHYAQLVTAEYIDVTGETDGGEVFKEYDRAEGVYKLKRIHHRNDEDDIERQIEVVNEEDLIRIQGNEKGGRIHLYSTDITPFDLLEWKDGLITTNQTEEGTDPNQLPFQFDLKKLWVCVDGTPEELYFVTYTPPAEEEE
jgi:hypothetical protein